MRHLYLLLALALLCRCANAQTISYTDSIPPMTEQRWSDTCFGLLNLTATNIPSGYLLDRSPSAFNDTVFNSLLTSSVDTLSDGILFFAIHNIMTKAAVNSSATYIGNTDTLYRDAFRYARNTGHIPILLLYQNYQKIRPTALSQGLFTLTPDSLRLNDVSGRSTSPYDNEYIFMMAPFNTTISQFGTLTFDLPAEFWLMPGLTSVQIDFGDGAGFRTLSKGGSVAINYNSNKTYYWTAKITTSSGTFTAKSNVIYQAPKFYFQPDTQFNISVAPLYASVQDYLNSGISGSSIQKPGAIHPQTPTLPACPADFNLQDLEPNLKCDINPGAQVEIMRGCDNVFDKPIIVLEGFDAQNNLTVQDVYKYFLGGTGLNQNFVSEMQHLGYDFVFVHFTKNQDLIENNAMVVVSLIQQLNSIKVGNNPGTIIGISMGSLIARWALKYMENNGINHQIANYVSYDGPQQGANIPLGLQFLFNEMTNDMPELKYFSSSFATLAASYSSPAARQMLVMNPVYSNGSPTSSVLDPVRAKFAQELITLGYPATNNYAISLGMGNNTTGTENAGNGAPFQFNFTPGANIFNGAITFLLENLNASVNATPTTMGTILKYRYLGEKVVKLFRFLPFPVYTLKSRTINASIAVPYDNAPGGFERVQTQFVRSFNGSSSFPPGQSTSIQNNGFAGNANNGGHYGHCFIPAASALDLQNQGYGSSSNYLSNNLYYNIDAAISNPGQLGGNTPVPATLSPFKAILTYSSDCSSTIPCASPENDPDRADAYHTADTIYTTPWNEWHEGGVSNQAELFLMRAIANTTSVTACASSTQDFCGDSLQISLTSGTNPVCINAQSVFTVSNERLAPGLAYSWSDQNGDLSIVSGGNTNVVTVQGVTSGNDVLIATATNTCNETNQYRYNLRVGPPTVNVSQSTAIITVLSPQKKDTIVLNPYPTVNNVCSNGSANVYLYASGQTSITWSKVSSTGTVSWNTTGDILGFQNFTSGGTTVFEATLQPTTCGTTTAELSFLSKPCGFTPPSSDPTGCSNFILSPNPTTNVVNVAVSTSPCDTSSTSGTTTNTELSTSAAKQTGAANPPTASAIKEIKIFDESGRLVQTAEYPGGLQSTQLNVAGFTPGLYLVQIRNTTGAVETHKIIVQRGN